ncbi:MAG: hypothetical protein A2Y70_07845 [Candidatus Aminicenantes bacterium RBG_13_64_14]|nr:MAG: hypothetical protein A2Y70_07845 [Candidatus Aminicenantes bacterium RBG_13_64_14]
MPDSIKTTRICLVVAAGLEIATAALILFIFLSGAVLVGWGTERSELLGSALLGATGITLAVLFAAYGVFGLFTAAGIAKGRPWSRIAGLVLAVLLLPAFPVGTVIGIFALKGLLGPDARAWFGTPNGAPPVSFRPPSTL